MARTVLSDPIRNFKFRVEITPQSKLATFMGAGATVKTGFSVVSGLTVQNEMVAYREGGMNTHPHKMIGQSDFGPVTFTKGVFADDDSLYRWQTYMHAWAQGGIAGAASTGANDYRSDITISVYDHPDAAMKYEYPNTGGETVPGHRMQYKLWNCWPASFSLGDLNAGDSSILIQQLVINHEGFQVAWNGSSVTASNNGPASPGR